MGFYDDHINAVAMRRAADAAKRGYNIEAVILERYGWSEQEIERIIKREKEFLSNGLRRI